MQAMRICPFCSEEVIATARKCRYCGEWLDGTQGHTTRSTPGVTWETVQLDLRQNGMAGGASLVNTFLPGSHNAILKGIVVGHVHSPSVGKTIELGTFRYDGVQDLSRNYSL
jgi:hypothetical protein